MSGGGSESRSVEAAEISTPRQIKKIQSGADTTGRTGWVQVLVLARIPATVD